MLELAEKDIETCITEFSMFKKLCRYICCCSEALIFLKRSLIFPILLFSSIFFFFLYCSLRRLSYLSLLFSGTLHSDGYIFPFLLCLSLIFFPQMFVRPPSTTILPFCISFSWGWFWTLPPIQCYEPPSIVLQALWELHLFVQGHSILSSIQAQILFQRLCS